MFIQIFNISYAASFLILAVTAARLVLRRAPKIYSYALWLLVLIRLLCPVQLESQSSLIPSAQVVSPEAVEGPSFRVHTGFAVIDHPANDYLGDHYFEGVTVRTGALQSTVRALNVVWLCGLAAMLGCGCFSLMRLSRQLVGAVRLGDCIWETDYVGEPFVMGIVRPRIYLPSGLGGHEREYIVLHEQTHIRRGDAVWRALAFGVLAVHWFNPLAWLAFWLSGRDMEMACDEAVLRRMPGDIRTEYAQSLLNLSSKGHFRGMFLAFGESSVKERIRNVLQYGRSRVWVGVIGILVFAALGIWLLPGPEQEAEALRGKSYRAEQVLYEAPHLSTYTRPEDMPEYRVTLDERLLARGQKDWVLEVCRLTDSTRQN